MTDIDIQTNGHQKGRAVPPLPEFVFKDTGRVVSLRKISPMLRDDIDMAMRREFPPPEPPVIEVDYGDRKVKEPNDADPDYDRLLRRWRIEHAERVSEQLLRVAIKRAVECEVDHEAVDQLRRDMAEIGITLDPDDKYVYVSRICIGTPEDLAELAAAIFRRSMPTPEAVEGHKAMFPGDIPGA